MEDQILSNVQNVLNRYSDIRNKILVEADQVVNRFNTLGISAEFEKYLNQHLKFAETVLEKFKDKGLSRFDLFRLAGFTASEENFSNAVAAILDPNRPHQLGKKPLQSVLKKILERNQDQISILSAVSDSKTIQVRRELNLGSTIPDILVESDKFIIFIENKIRHGKETLNSNSHKQTDRQWKELERRGKSLGVPDNCKLGIFLTPEGKLPANNNFVRLSVSEFVEAIDDLLKTESTEYNNTIKAFLQFYKLS
ncbi:PD-(D/E)XK nuclease family protein [Desulfotignum phosphitoxidans]|uniref:Uncharacterized protein n=1 Tax=Desulfotignum phosphitoxidans DSM 13687 TaxID=1286635 RepID=S0FUP3_9BACT|nr:PD-(D/E)XK nuclease family protein [Desulfotignum phosphitoxidans]EMS78430.1 hypothetical protein Dpo_8c00970 [Desulfotignum phosphitoxidans DSM 13687]